MSDNDGLILKQAYNGGARYLEIIDDEKIVLRQRKGKQKSEHIISLLALDANGKKTINANWLCLSLGVGVPGIILIYLMVASLESTQQIALTVISVLLLGLGLYLFVRSLSRQYVFYTRHSKIPVIELSINNPSKTEFDHFKNEVKDRIRSIQEAKSLSSNDLLAGEMRMLRRLEGEKLIDKKAYEEAKAKLLNLFGDKPEFS